MKKHLIQFVCQSNKHPRPELARELLPWTYGTTGLGSLHHRFSIRHEAGASFQKCKQNFEFHHRKIKRIYKVFDNALCKSTFSQHF